MNPTLESEEKTNCVEVTDFAEYSAVIQEIMQTTWFIADTSIILDEAEEWCDGMNGNPTPFYPVQLRQLIRTATNKQMSLIERLEHLTTVRPELSGPSLDVLDMPDHPKKISDRTRKA